MTTKQKIGVTLRTNDNLQTLYVDGARINKRNDGMYFIMFTADLPDGTFEQSRMVVDEIHLKAILNVICKISNCYPKKPSKSKKPKT